MKVFLSSVRRGLEVERDALPGLIKAIGHEPISFEQFTAQTVPSREACLAGVDAADAYLLLLGAHYGHVFPETGQSATHDEYQRARQRGIPRLVYTKAGAAMDPEQAAFAEAIGEYGSGSFWATFTDVGNLQTQVAEALRELASRPGVLDYQTLTTAVQVSWRGDWETRGHLGADSAGIAELHVVPLTPSPIPARLMRAMPDRLIGAVRASSIVPAHAGLDPWANADGAGVEVPAAPRAPMGAVASGALRGVRVGMNGQVSVWWSLPTDGMGAMLNEAELAEAFAQGLRLAGAVGLPDAARYAVATGVTGSLVTIVDGRLPQASRSTASLGLSSDRPCRVLPDESVPAAAFENGAAEVGRDLAAGLIAEFRAR